MKFPMYTVPLEMVMAMKKLRMHEDLMDDGVLDEFKETMGRATFVSHQWVSKHHPDPDFMQFKILQKALQNLLDGASQVSLPPAIECYVGRVRLPKTADFRAKSLHIWYDYFCCPQGTTEEAAHNRQLAIDCIPSYTARAFFFVILCPAVPHNGDGYKLSYATWDQRGWCRLEHMARELARDDGFIIKVETATHPSLDWNMHGVGKAPGKGDFSFEEDRLRVGLVLDKMFWTKLQNFLEKGNLHGYRFLLNLHHSIFAGVESVANMRSLVPGFRRDTHSEDHLRMAKFLHDNKFKSPVERDSAGWSPLCYAAMKGDSVLVQTLLQSRADANDRLTKKKKECNLSKNLPVLSLATAYQNNEVVKILLEAKAKVNARCNFQATPLIWAATSDNAAAVSILCDAGVNPKLKVFPDTSPFRVACLMASVQTVKEMMNHFPVSLRYCLHISMVFFGDADTVSTLIDASANIDEQLRVPMSRCIWWSFLKAMKVRHHTSPSVLTHLAYHNQGATALMFAILTGKFEAARVLVEAGARLDLKNDRGKTAVDLLDEMHAPYLLGNDTMVKVASIATTPSGGSGPNCSPQSSESSLIRLAL
eukprot:Skav221048  [mRNA]  locus=scaffold1448:307985:309760:+ [translate_table: standard]